MTSVTHSHSHSMIKGARIMGLDVVAEQVETAEILRRLQEQNVDFTQDWHLHKPERLPQHAEEDSASISTHWSKRRSQSL